MAQSGLSCNGIAVDTVAEFEAALAGLGPADPVEVRCPAIFPETECRDLLRAIGFGALTVEIRGHLFTAVHGCFPSVGDWARACGRERLPAPGVRVAIRSRGKQFRAEELARAIAALRAAPACAPVLSHPADIPARISSVGAVALDAATWAAHTTITQ